MYDEKIYQIALTKIPFVGAKIARQLIAYCGNIEGVFREKKSKLLKIPRIGEKTAEAIAFANPYELAIADWEHITKHGVETLFFLDKSYPHRLKHLEDAPVLLYVKGKARWNAPRTLSIVGTRLPSTYGRQLCARFIRDIVPFNVQIISGLAYGIDALVHQICNDHGVENMAVMGTGMDIIYPAQHRKLAIDIISNGALLTEYPIRTRADRENFPRRNRIIAGLSDAVVIVQSKERGGSLITAAYANAYHRDVFAFPGRASDRQSKGCNALIKNHQAHLIESASDLTAIMRWDDDQPSVVNGQASLFPNLTEDQQAIVDYLKNIEIVHIDRMQNELGFTPSELAAALLMLECQGIVVALPGKSYALPA